MLIKINSGALLGLDGKGIEVEVDVAKGHPNFNIVGLTDLAIQEAKQRIRSAIKNCGYAFPFQKRVTINLAPADIHKVGASYDLPMALGIVIATQNLPLKTKDSLFIGELSLAGKLRRVSGILPITIFAKEKGIKNIFLPKDNAKEASLIEGINIYPADNLPEVLFHISGYKKISSYDQSDIIIGSKAYEFDISDIKGHEHVKRAMEIAAAGAHNLIMSGPPGSGKTLIARTIPSILPKITVPEILEVTRIYSVAGLLSKENSYINFRPFRSPHHTCSGASLVGGGRIPKPGEISLAHRGVLFLDELAEFPRRILEYLRQPMEDGIVSISRANGSLTFPARFMLVASLNPCPCGYLHDRKRECVCSLMQIANYQKRLSGPLLDRIDLHLEVPALDYKNLADCQCKATSDIIRAKVQEARDRQYKRFKGCQVKVNSEMTPRQVKEFCAIDLKAQDVLKKAFEKMKLSGRSYHRILKLARTIADCEGADIVSEPHICEALQYRPKID